MSGFSDWLSKAPPLLKPNTDLWGSVRSRLGVSYNPAPPAAPVAQTAPPLAPTVLGQPAPASPAPSAPVSANGQGPYPYADLIGQAATKYNLDPSLLAAMMQQESGFNPRATSGAGAMGLLQLMPGTAREVGVQDPYDPYQNVMGGAQYLSKIRDWTGSSDPTDWLRAYNGGIGNWKRGVYPEETQRYVPAVMNYWSQYKGS